MEDGATWRVNTERAGQLASQLARVHAELVDFTAHLLETSGWSGDGVRSPEHWLQVYTGLSITQSRQLVHLAERRQELPTTVEMVAQGRMSLDQAAVIARHVPDWAEQQVAELGETLSVTQLARVAAKYPFEREQRSYEEPRTPPSRRGSELTMTRHGDRFRLRFETDAVQGALVEQAILEAKDALFNAGNERATLGDGLVEVASRSLDSVTSPTRRDHYKVMIHLDVTGRGWVGRKGSVPPNLLAHITCDGSVRPVWESEGVPVSVGRAQRIVPQRTRRLVEDRDGGCRYPGCSATGFLENHHIVPWSEGGATDMDSLVSLCPHHHREHHREQFTISGNPNTPDGLVFLTRDGWRIGKYLPQTPLDPPEKVPRPRYGAGGAVRGERLDYGAVYFRAPTTDPDIDPADRDIA